VERALGFEPRGRGFDSLKARCEKVFVMAELIALSAGVVSVIALLLGFLTFYQVDLGLALLALAVVSGIYVRIAQATYQHNEVVKLLKKD
jgi:hypothetical protein